MRYRRIHEKQPESLITKDTEKLYIPLANWGNVHAAYQKMDFLTQYLDHERGRRYKVYYQNMGLIA